MKKNIVLLSTAVLIILSGCAANKNYQGKITKNFTAIAGASGKFKNDSLFRKTTITLSTYSEFISLYNLQKKPKPVEKKYANNFGNYATLLDTLANLVQNNTAGYEAVYSQSMNFIQNDVKDKFINLCPTCAVRDYHPVLVDVKIKVADKTGKESLDYNVYMQPALSYGSSQLIAAGKSGSVLKGVVPGYYKIWIERAGKRAGEKYEHIKNQTQTAIIDVKI